MTSCAGCIISAAEHEYRKFTRTRVGPYFKMFKYKWQTESADDMWEVSSNTEK